MRSRFSRRAAMLLAVLATVLGTLLLSSPAVQASPQPPPVKVTGGGWFVVNPATGDKATFGFEVMNPNPPPITPPSPIRGTFEYYTNSLRGDGKH